MIAEIENTKVHQNYQTIRMISMITNNVIFEVILEFILWTIALFLSAPIWRKNAYSYSFVGTTPEQTLILILIQFCHNSINQIIYRNWLIDKTSQTYCWINFS